MNLYQRIRPTSFDGVLGNEQAIASLQKELDKPEDKRSQVFLLNGPSGCGKTTLARIAADILGADQMTLREYNSSNNRGIDTAREIAGQMSYVSGGAWVWILDEVHMTTKDWQNAMLKPLEDTPPGCYFFLCTTDPQKLIKPLLSRCTEIRVNTIPTVKMRRYLRKLVKQEEIEISNDVLDLIADSADGHVRKSLVLLEQVMNLENEGDMFKLVKEAAMDPDVENPGMIDLCRAIMKRATWKKCADILKQLKEDKVNPESIRRTVLAYMSSVALGGNSEVLNIMEEFIEPTYDSDFPGIVAAVGRCLL